MSQEEDLARFFLDQIAKGWVWTSMRVWCLWWLQTQKSSHFLAGFFYWNPIGAHRGDRGNPEKGSPFPVLLTGGEEQQPLLRLHPDSTPISHKKQKQSAGTRATKTSLMSPVETRVQLGTTKKRKEKKKLPLGWDRMGAWPSIMSGRGAGILLKATPPTQVHSTCFRLGLHQNVREYPLLNTATTILTSVK